MNKPNPDFFNDEMAEKYDQRNQNLAPIADGLHFLSSLVLNKLPQDSKVLSVGAGTGAEILFLAKAFPSWTFVAVDPSRSMLDVCQKRLEKAGISHRVELVVGETKALPSDSVFDCALSFLVGHFIPEKLRFDFYNHMVERLKSGGILLNAEISYDLDSPEFSFMLDNWKMVQSLMGATPESLVTIPKTLKEILHILPPKNVEDLLKKSGINQPVQFYQAFMISAWHGTKI